MKSEAGSQAGMLALRYKLHQRRERRAIAQGQAETGVGKDIIFQYALKEENTKEADFNPKHKSTLMTVYTH